ncbi:MAG TPA: NAD(P)H-hydrate dehydratase [Thermohalobaculum sp.]|nr:NAD(P)H-hydrate dehydratase [Thermohalobaculum sp.]
MTELLTAAQMRAIEEAAIASGAVTGLELMERAGRGVVAAILERRPELACAPHRAVVLCGPGNNGGDGFVVARLLRQRGWEVEVFLYGDPGRLPPDARANYECWADGGSVTPLGFPEIKRRGLKALSRALRAGSMLSDESDNPSAPALIVDAIFGTGLSRPADALSPLFGMSEYLHGSIPAHWVAIDAPSGMCTDSGRLYRPSDDLQTPHPVITADLTVTFHRPKVGHFLDRADVWCGRLVVRDIGLDGFHPEEQAGLGSYVTAWAAYPAAEVTYSEFVTALLLRKQSSDHKYHHGHALILAGGPGKGGAARLAARGALRVGAGLVTVGAPPEAVPENAAQLNAIMLRPVADAEALAETLRDERLNAIGLGPGLGVGERTRGLVTAALAARRGTVLDADALTSFADDPAALFALLHERCVLTPHMGEFARLFPEIAAKLSAPATKGPACSKVDAARAAAARAGCAVLLKGPDTVIADAQGRAAINSAHYQRAAPWLATAGAGDVLAGMIAGLLARGFAPMAAAETAAWLHVEAARRFGPGLIAEDLPETLPAVLRDLGL